MYLRVCLSLSLTHVIATLPSGIRLSSVRGRTYYVLEGGAAWNCVLGAYMRS